MRNFGFVLFTLTLLTTYAVQANEAPGATSTDMEFVSSGDYNIRLGPGKEHSIVGFVTRGKPITSHSCLDNWCSVTVNGITGYIHKNALTLENSASYQGVAAQESVGDLSLGSPVCGCVRGTCYVTSGFGPRKSRRTTNGRRMSSNHTGVDIGGGEGTMVVAVESGAIVESGRDGGYGKSITIDHGQGMKTQYSHLKHIYRASGHVQKGETIGAMGSTGNVTGPHLDLRFLINDVPVDPKNYISYDTEWLSRPCDVVRAEGAADSANAGSAQ